jgi:hypothetical protein
MNAAGATNLVSYPSNQNIEIHDDGTSFLTLSLPSQQTRCALNFYKYPFDSQKCSIVIGSWIYDDFDVNFTASNKSDYSSFVDHPYWQLTSINQSWVADASRFNLHHVSNHYKSQDLAFELVLKRRPLYTMITSIFINFVLNIVILLAFWMPIPSQIIVCKQILCLYLYRVFFFL